MAIFGKISTLDLEFLCREQYPIIINYINKLQKKYVGQGSFNLDVGEHENFFLSKDVYAIEQVYETKERDLCDFEAHKKYIDIHYIVDGSERIAVSSASELSVAREYDDEGDYILYKTPMESSTLLLTQGDIAIFFPDDAHMTAIEVKGKARMTKTVIKLPRENWIG